MNPKTTSQTPPVDPSPEDPLAITDHAIQRAEERFGWKKDTLDRMAEKAWDKGVTRKHFSGQLRDWLDKRIEKFDSGHRTCIYGDAVFVFHGRVLVTILRLPNDFKRAVARADKKKVKKIKEYEPKD